MDICGKHKMNFSIEYELKGGESIYCDNNPTMTLSQEFNRKQCKAFIKGVALTNKYLKKMQRLGFTPVVAEIETESE